MTFASRRFYSGFSAGIVTSIFWLTCLLLQKSFSQRVLPSADKRYDDVSFYFSKDDVQVSCNSGAELSAAFNNPAVESIIVGKDITLTNADWANYDLPVTLTRNITVTGPADSPVEQWPILDAAFLVDKVVLGPGVSLTFTQLVMYRGREGAYFQVPGFSLIAPKLRSTTEAPGMLRFHNMTSIQPICLPVQSLRSNSTGTLPRPPEAPGTQQASYLPPPADCVNSSSPAVPAMRRCWGVYGMYDDMAWNGAELDLATGKAVLLNYIIWATHTMYLCPSRMSPECINQTGGFIQCYYKLFPKANGSVPAGNAFQPPPHPPAVVSALGPHGSGGDNAADSRRNEASSSSGLLGPLLGGLLGGVVLMAAIASTVFVLLRKRRRKKQDLSDLRAAKYYGGPREEPKSVVFLTPSIGADETYTTMTPTGTQTATHSEETVEESHNKFLVAHPSGNGGIQLAAAGPPQASYTELVPVTALTPLLPGVNLSVNIATEVQLTATTLGAGTYGRVVRGVYGGVPVAVKLVKAGLGGVHVGGHQAAPGGEVLAAGGVDQPAPLVRSCADGTDVTPSALSPSVSMPTAVAAAEQPRRPEAAGASDGSAKNAAECQLDGREAVAVAGQRCAYRMGERTMAHSMTLVQEVEVLARCQHPNIVRLLAASVTCPDLCLVMELMDTSLDKMMYGKGQGAHRDLLMPLPKVIHIGIQVARALSYLHPTILHRDLKPANVLIKGPDSDEPVAKLADFGLSRLLSTVLVTQDPEVGTAPYMAPETFDLEENVTITDKSDIYSLGVILYEMLSGKRPWEGFTIVQIAFAIHVKRLRPSLESLPNSRCPHKLGSLILSCWEHDPQRRPAAAEVVKVLALVQEAVKQDTSAAMADTSDR